MSPKRRKPIRWLNAARADLAEVVARIMQNSPQEAERFAEQLLEHVELLSDFPYLGLSAFTTAQHAS